MTRPSAYPTGNRSSPTPIEVNHLTEFTPPSPPTTLSTRATEVWESVWDAGRDAWSHGAGPLGPTRQSSTPPPSWSSPTPDPDVEGPSLFGGRGHRLPQQGPRMKYRALRTFATLTRTFHEGQEYEVNPTEAEPLIAQSFLEEVNHSSPKKTPILSSSKTETFVAADVEVASDL